MLNPTISNSETNCEKTKQSLKECTEISDQILKSCDSVIEKGKEKYKAKTEEYRKCMEIVDQQTHFVANKNKQIEELTEEKENGRIIFSIIGFALGFIIGVPISF